jgi:hypothetical protein
MVCSELHLCFIGHGALFSPCLAPSPLARRGRRPAQIQSSLQCPLTGSGIVDPSIMMGLK